MTAKSKILQSINSIHRVIAAEGIGKNGSADIKTKNGGTFSFKFQKLDDIYNVISPLLAAENVICIPSVISEVETIEQIGQSRSIRSKVTVDYTFTHLEDESSITVRSIGEDSDTGSKSTVKAMSAAHKTALKQLFMIPVTGDNDSNRSNGFSSYNGHDNVNQSQPQEFVSKEQKSQFISDGQLQWLSNQIKEIGMDMSAILRHYKINEFTQLPKLQYEELRKVVCKRREEIKVN